MTAAAAGVLAERQRVPSGRKKGTRRGARDTLVSGERPPWRAWRTRSRVARAIRFMETYCVVPSGPFAGRLMRVRGYQRLALEELLAGGVRTGGLQLPRGNAKSTLWAAVGLWALCDHADTPQVPLVAFNGKQATRNLLDPIAAMVRSHPELENRLVPYSAVGDRRVWSRWNNGTLITLPAEVDALQGLNPTIALVDEAQTIGSDVFGAVMQGAGKRAESLVLAIGTPAPQAESSALFGLRSRAGEGARVVWVEHAATSGCDIEDRNEWRRANPAIRAGLLDPKVLAAELELVSEAEFRMYRLGQWVDATVVGWLPGSAWDDCPTVSPPDAGAEVVLGLAGTYSSSFALMGATFDGGVFTGWIAQGAEEAELERVVADAFDTWNVTALIVAPRILPSLVARLTDAGRPVQVWTGSTEMDVSSSTEFRRAVVEGRLAHDHDPTLAAHIGATVGASTADGMLRLVAPKTGAPVDAARAARMAWWTASHLERAEMPAIF